MKNRLLISASVLSSVAIVATAFAMSNNQTACMRDAVIRQAESDQRALEDFNREIEEAGMDRINGLGDAWTITNDRDRNNEIRQVEREFNDREREAKRILRDLEREARRQFSDDRRECREEQKELCQRVECPNGKRVTACDRDGNPLPDPCSGQSSSSSRSSRSSSSRSSSRFSTDSDRCRSSNDCRSNEYCSVEDGDCFSPCEPGVPCVLVCEGICKPRSQRSSSRSSSSRSSSSRSSSRLSSSSSSRVPICGDGRCEGSENAILCPVCAQGTDPDLCRCRRVCEADCG